MPDEEAVTSGIQGRAVKLQPYEQSLKKFEYKKAFDQALAAKNPEVVLALIEELVERGALERALAGRTPEGLLQIVAFLRWKMVDHRYQGVLVEVARVILDMYSAPLTLCREAADVAEQIL